MKKKNGFTMMELMVSIAIIAVVMVFLVRLLVDIRYDKTNELYDTANQINRAEIIKTIEEDFLNLRLMDVTDTGSTNTTLKLQLIREDGKIGEIIVNENNDFSYINCAGKKRKWKLEKNNNETYIKKTNISFKLIQAVNNLEKKNDLNDYTVLIDIPVIVDKSKLRETNDSKMDNILLTFSGYGETLLKNVGNLNQN